MRKDKYLQIFNYLKEFSKLRSNPVRDISTSETQYLKKIWLHDIPENKTFENIIRSDFNGDNEHWIKARKPREPQKPKFAKLSDNLEKWIDKPTLLNGEGKPRLKKSVEGVKNFLKIQKELQQYIDNEWTNDWVNYDDNMKRYENEYKEYEKLDEFYRDLFGVYNKTQQLGEEYELIVGIGLLYFKGDETPKIFRHILTQRVDINFEYPQNEKNSEITISPSLESSPQLEVDSILDLPMYQDAIVRVQDDIENHIKNENIETIFEDRKYEYILRKFVQGISNGEYYESTAKPEKIPSEPKITFSPALLLRKRNTRSFTASYENIIQKIENDNDPQISIMNDLVDTIPSNHEADITETKPSANTSLEPIFFPKDYNEEQIKIIEKAEKNNKVLVQGPPGTGKSHTIANLICHLLANGKKLLITAYTKRALEVIKDNLPCEFRDLAVNLLGGDSSSIQDLQSSVNVINDELSKSNLGEYESEIDKFDCELKQVRKKIAETKNNLVGARERATREHSINEKYKGTLTIIAQSLERDASSHEWYEDNFIDIENDAILLGLKDFILLHKSYQLTKIDEFKYKILDLKKLISPSKLKEYANLNNELDKLTANSPLTLKDQAITCSSFEALTQDLMKIKQLYHEVKQVKLPSDFISEVKNSSLKGEKPKWRRKLNVSESILGRIKDHDFREIDRNIKVKYPDGKNLIQIKSDAEILRNYVESGGVLNTGFIRGRFLPSEIRERSYFIDGVRVNGSPCNTIDELKTVLKDISFKQDFIELSRIWGKSPNEDSLYNEEFLFYENTHNEVQKLFKIIEHLEALKSTVESKSNLQINLFDDEDLEKSILKTKYTEISEDISRYKDLVNQSEAYLNSENFHPIKENIIFAYGKLDCHSYDELWKEMESLIENQEKFLSFQNLRSDLYSKLPSIVSYIEKGGFSVQAVHKLKDAIYFRNAKIKFDKLMSDDCEKKLIQELGNLERGEKTLIAKLASKKAWCQVIKNLKENSGLRAHLTAWAMAVQKIGTTGKGKRAMKFRKIAQEEMEHCKDSVPCWIMPLYKVAETVRPEQGMYDYVIIDEASQLGPDAIFLFYISKKIIIVGDDKQTSPEYIGVDAGAMTPHINRHLNEIPFANYYGTEFSIFDLAKLFCEQPIVLREHFRCMPEIIQFSNRYFYAPEGKDLYPLKQYSENRLEPLVLEFCQDGYIEGSRSRIVNEPEAIRIAEKIGDLVRNERYNKKTFGVITLQGNQQASMIENLILKRIGEKEFHERKIVCGNSSFFQGGERDIIFLSLVTAHNHNRSALTRPEDERRFNVAASRAKEQMWLFHSIRLEDLGDQDLRYKLLDHFENYKPTLKIPDLTPIEGRERELGTQPHPFDSWFEVDVYTDIKERQTNVIPQYEVAGGRYRIDMVILLRNGVKMAVECDGDRWHGPDQHWNDLMRQRALERCGWPFFRVRSHEYYTNKEKALEPLWNMIKESLDSHAQDIEATAEKYSTPTPNSIHRFADQSREVILESSATDSNNIHRDTENIEIATDELKPPDSNSDESQTLRYLNLFKTGTYILTKDEPLEEADYVVRIEEMHREGFLLQCYRSGHINKVNISVLLSKKIEKEYKNGLNKDEQLLHIEAIDSEKIIGIYFSENGERKFKAHMTDFIPARELLQLQGYKVIYNKDFQRVKFKVLPVEIKNDIDRLVFKSFSAVGKLVDHINFKDEWKILEKY